MWFYQQTPELQEKVRGLVKNGQLELINAGWSMHDEACPIFDDMINNMKIGHDFILKEFDFKPTIGWQIDPFGHSNANVRISAEMGFDAWFYARLDNSDKGKRTDERTLEFVHIPNKESLGSETRIFEHVLWNHYEAPNGFNFDMIDGDVGFIIDPANEDYNAPTRAVELMKELDDRIQHYVTDDILVLFGTDFKYENAYWNY